MKTVSVRIQVTTIQQGTQFSRLTNNLLKRLGAEKTPFFDAKRSTIHVLLEIRIHVSLCFVISGNEKTYNVTTPHYHQNYEKNSHQ